MSNRPLVAPRSLGLISILMLLTVILGIVRLIPRTQNPEPISQMFAPSQSPTPSPVPTSIPTPTLTPPPSINPITGWKTYQNTQYGFSFEYPPDWNQTEFYGKNEPLVLIGKGEGRDVAAMTITLNELFSPESSSTSATSAWSYLGWRGLQSQSKESGVSLTMINASPAADLNSIIRIAWIRSVDKGNPYTIDAFFKPILKTFRFTEK